MSDALVVKPEIPGFIMNPEDFLDSAALDDFLRQLPYPDKLTLDRGVEIPLDEWFPVTSSDDGSDLHMSTIGEVSLQAMQEIMRVGHKVADEIQYTFGTNQTVNIIQPGGHQNNWTVSGFLGPDARNPIVILRRGEPINPEVVNINGAAERHIPIATTYTLVASADTNQGRVSRTAQMYAESGIHEQTGERSILVWRAKSSKIEKYE